MKVVIAPDSFKGSLSAFDVCSAIEMGIKNVDPSIIVHKVPMADGGEGTVQALVQATGGTIIRSKVMGPMVSDVEAEWGMLGDEKSAVIEMAAASGLPLVSVEKRNPLETTSYGTGQLIKAAVERGAKRILLGIGGSATSEFGCGMAQALGIRFFDHGGVEVKDPINGRLLGTVFRIDASGLVPALKDCDIQVACDVDNPLLGPKGAVYTYSPQKGADEAMCARLEGNMRNIAHIVANQFKDVTNIVGAGAAGGMGGGLVAFLNATLRPGVDIVLEAVELADKLAGADLVITGEGKLDQQTIYGKTIAGVARVAVKRRVPVIAFAGSVDVRSAVLSKIGVTAAFSICQGPMDLQTAMKRTRPLLIQLTENFIRLFLMRGKM